jgi:hypothetical protein
MEQGWSSMESESLIYYDQNSYRIRTQVFHFTEQTIGAAMKKGLIACCAVVILLAFFPGCAPAVPTPTIEYQVARSITDTIYMVVVRPQDNKNRDGLLSIAGYLCTSKDLCYIYFWDDAFYVAMTFPMLDFEKQEMIATYAQNQTAGQKELLDCGLGECQP